ncbi:MAG: DNA replication and repair protein RecF, partial [Pedobacter sp.]
VSHHDFGQIFITDTGKERVKSIFENIDVDVTLFEVEEGQIKNA